MLPLWLSTRDKFATSLYVRYNYCRQFQLNVFIIPCDFCYLPGVGRCGDSDLLLIIHCPGNTDSTGKLQQVPSQLLQVKRCFTNLKFIVNLIGEKPTKLRVRFISFHFPATVLFYSLFSHDSDRNLNLL
jgi:hypothetical protein